MPRQLSLTELKSEVNRLAVKIGAPDDLLPTYGYSMDGARPHIEVDSQGYYYIVAERGQEISRVTTAGLDEVLYQVSKNVTFSLACNYELKHRVEHQIALLSSHSSRWGELETQEHERILQIHPYQDK